MSVEVVVTRKSNTIRNFPCTILQSPVVLTRLKASLVSTTVSTHKASTSRTADLGLHPTVPVGFFPGWTRVAVLMEYPPLWPSDKASTPTAADRGSIHALPVGLFFRLECALPAFHHRADDGIERVIVGTGLRVQPPSVRWQPDVITERQSRKCPNNIR